MEIVRLDCVDSTNSWVASNETDLASPSLVWSQAQTQGRGQRGNSWESEPGKNITASLIFHPENFPAIRQFEISEAVALAIVDFLASYGVEAHIKWPNDIYVGDKKICGILVEHVVTGKNITRTIAGVGININQEEFKSDAPNPVSLLQISGRQHDLEKAIENLALRFDRYLGYLAAGKDLHEAFKAKLWRKDNAMHGFIDRKSNERIEAAIHDVSPLGILSLSTRKGDIRTYAFKEVEYIL